MHLIFRKHITILQEITTHPRGFVHPTRRNIPAFCVNHYTIQLYRAKIIFLLLCNNNSFVRSSEKFRELPRNSEIPGNSGKCRKIFSEKIPGNFPPDFPAFSGDETYVTALILSFKKSKSNGISRNFGRKFPGNSGKFFPKTTRNFLRIFLRFFN